MNSPKNDLLTPMTMESRVNVVHEISLELHTTPNLLS